jgi:hypothetical protein
MGAHALEIEGFPGAWTVSLTVRDLPGRSKLRSNHSRQSPPDIFLSPETLTHGMGASSKVYIR